MDERLALECWQEDIQKFTNTGFDTNFTAHRSKKVTSIDRVGNIFL